MPTPRSGQRSRSLLVASLLVTALVAVSLWSSCARRDAPRPHIVLITADALRADHLSSFGYARLTSPNLDEFARGAWHFTEALTVIPKTGPSFATMFTGRHPEEHHVRSNFETIPESLPMLAETLKARGYRTAAFISNPVLRENRGYGRGFDQFTVCKRKETEPMQAVTREFQSWAADPWTEPTFVWIHYIDPHGPYKPPAEYESLFLDDELARSEARAPIQEPPPAEEDPDPTFTRGDRRKVLGTIPLYQAQDGEERLAPYIARYDAEIRAMDALVGEVLQTLRTTGVYDSSAVVFTADHGESLGEHDFYFEHGWFAYEPSMHVPLMLKAPGQAEGQVVSQPVSNLDLAPTLLTLAGIDVDQAMRGSHLLDLPEDRPPLLIQNADLYEDKFHGLRGAGWKYLRRTEDGTEEVYDLRLDPGELHNLAGADTRRTGELRLQLEGALRRAQEAQVPRATGIVEDDPETLERLKELGYAK